MARLMDLGLREHPIGEHAIAILVGPNGSGKSRLLRELAEDYRHNNLLIVSNTPHDRFAGTRGIKRISAGRSDQTPANIVKRAVARSLDQDDSNFHQINAILEYCGYLPRFAFRIAPGQRYGISFENLLALVGENEEADPGDFDPSLPGKHSLFGGDLHRALAFLQRHDAAELVWVEALRSAIEFSMMREFASVLRWETFLRRHLIIGSVEVLLQREDRRGEVLEMRHASSGQLALISSLLFLITQAGHRPLILVDEPENSLHPTWQREYVDKLLAAMTYRDATIVIATHAPLIVTGALREKMGPVSVCEVRGGVPTPLKIEAGAAPSSIEEILWRAFDVVTPANHFVSEEIVRAISRYEEDEIGKGEVLALVANLNEHSFDERQKMFFVAVRQLVEKVEAAKAGFSGGDDNRA